MYQCRWGSNNSTIACVHRDSEYSSNLAIVTFDPQGRILNEYPLSISEVPSFQWSPDNNAIAVGYFSEGEGKMDILSMADNSRSFLSAGIPLTWSPDGQWIIVSHMDSSYSTTNNLSIVNATTGSSYAISETDWKLIAWQPSTFETPDLSDAEEVATPSAAEQEANDGDVAVPGECSTLTITVLDTPKGDYYQICDEGIEYYEVGPLEKGDYAIGPNNKFFVYSSNSGQVYAARVGSKTLKLIGDISTFSMIIQDKAPEFEFEFFGDHPYSVQIYEKTFQEFSDVLSIPRYITTPN